ncbi:hypothetical protein LJR225_004832 [Phenylobacterium sp. LjRoot225]|uniref:hypothetical protein n=1 Tax=Phenylobacterium sp. LjRoot225 TaxID=3342285 RepID=UPI003ECFEB93
MIERVHEAGQGIADTTVKVLQRAAKKAIAAGAPRIELAHVAADAIQLPPIAAGRKVVRRPRRRRL